MVTWTVSHIHCALPIALSIKFLLLYCSLYTFRRLTLEKGFPFQILWRWVLRRWEPGRDGVPGRGQRHRLLVAPELTAAALRQHGDRSHSHPNPKSCSRLPSRALMCARGVVILFTGHLPLYAQSAQDTPEEKQAPPPDKRKHQARSAPSKSYSVPRPEGLWTRPRELG